jgi:menaquinone-dependent protoporphyrinogen oxidase
MKRILVTYVTFAGSTAEVAHVIDEELTRRGLQVDVLPTREVQDLAAYDGVVLGGPMMVGWHRTALRFLRKNRGALRRIPFAVFVLAISLTRTGETVVDGTPIFLDEKLPKPPARAGHLSLHERYARLPSYVRPILRATAPLRPASVGLFGGRLEYGRLPWWAVLFVTLIIRAPARDRRNWPAIRAWAAGLPAALQLEGPEAKAPTQAA